MKMEFKHYKIETDGGSPVDLADEILTIGNEQLSHQVMAVAAHSANRARNSGFSNNKRFGWDEHTGKNDTPEQLISRRLS